VALVTDEKTESCQSIIHRTGTHHIAVDMWTTRRALPTSPQRQQRQQRQQPQQPQQPQAHLFL